MMDSFSFVTTGIMELIFMDLYTKITENIY